MLANGFDFFGSDPKQLNKPVDQIETPDEMLMRVVNEYQEGVEYHDLYTEPRLYRRTLDGNLTERDVNGFEFTIESVADMSNAVREVITADEFVVRYHIGDRSITFYDGADCGGYDVERKMFVKE